MAAPEALAVAEQNLAVAEQNLAVAEQNEVQSAPADTPCQI
jgi:hypothetical protein